MGKYSKIAVIYGSDSSEWEVSCQSGEFTASRIDGTEYDVYEIFARFGKWQLVAMKKRDAMRIAFPEGSRPEIDKTDFSVKVLGEKVRFDFAFIMQHGTPGESGLLQGYLEMLGIPFSTCSAFVSTVVFDKFACKSYLRDEDFVKTAPDVFVRKGMDMEAVTAKIVSKLKFPVFVKPTDAGSSFGITKVKTPEDLPEAIRFAFSEGQMVCSRTKNSTGSAPSGLNITFSSFLSLIINFSCYRDSHGERIFRLRCQVQRSQPGDMSGSDRRCRQGPYPGNQQEDIFPFGLFRSGQDRLYPCRRRAVHD